MPSVPRFTISQNDDFVLVTIKVPYIRVTSAEVVTDGHDFSFYCAPYLLKLTFPGEFAEDDERCKAVYDPYNDHGTLVAHLPKKTPGELFPDLDLTTKLLQLRRAKDVEESKQDGIEVLESLEMDDAEGDSVDAPNGQTLLGLATIKYGFNLGYSKVLAHLRDELVDMLEIRDPETVPVSNRRALRLQSENMRFDVERYLGDHFEGESDGLYLEAMSFKPFWVKQWDLSKDLDKETKQQKVDPADGNCTSVKSNNKDKAFELVGGFTEAERQTLSGSLKHKEYLIVKNSPEELSCLFILADILFAYCYDVRMTQGDESNVESAANIARMSAALSWLDPMNSPLDSVSSVIKCCLRRSIILPYLRVWKLSRKVLTDVTKILFLGKRCILKCLLHVRHHFEHTDTHYLLNKLYLDDLCVWIQSEALDEGRIASFAREYNNAKTAIETSPYQGKEFMGFHLPKLEKWAAEEQQEDIGKDVEEEEEEQQEDSDEEEDDDDSSAGDDSDASSEASDAIPAKLNAEDGSLLYSVPRNLLVYTDQHLSSSDLAYLDCTLPELVLDTGGSAKADDNRVESVVKLLEGSQGSKASSPPQKLNTLSLPSLPSAGSTPTKRVLIEEISSIEFSTASEEATEKSDIQRIEGELSNLQRRVFHSLISYNRSTELKMDVMEMIRNFYLSIVQWFLKFLNQVESKNLLKLENFLPWFEANILLRPVTCNIPNLNNTVQLLDNSLNQLKAYSTDYRSTFNPSSLHYARQLKLCDQIDLLWNDYQVGKQLIASSQCLYPYNSNLPDGEYLRDLMHKVKGKLKIIDDLTLIRRTDAQNVKAKGKSSNDNSKKSFELPTDIKNELKVVSNLIDAMEIETLKNSMLLNYFSELKQSVHRPFHQLRVIISELPNIQQSKALMASEMDAYRAACDHYNEARSAESLVQCARLRNDKQDIEKSIDLMFNCLRILLNGQFSEPCWGSVSGDGTFTEWSSVLLKFVKQPISESMNSIAPGIVQSIESGGQDVFLKALEQLQTSLGALLADKRAADQWSKFFSEQVLDEIKQLDTELFMAYCQDWFDKMQGINVLVKSEEFIASYKTLMAARVNVQKARTQYDKCVLEYNAALTKRKEATAQVESLKKKLVEITLTELYEDIAFVQPVE